LKFVSYILKRVYHQRIFGQALIRTGAFDSCACWSLVVESQDVASGQIEKQHHNNSHFHGEV